MSKATTCAVSRAALAAALLICAAAGCEETAILPESARPPASGMSDAEFVDYVACLTLALEEGLAHPEAALRAEALGARSFRRTEVEEYLAGLGADAERWVAVFESIDERIGELRREQKARR
jgi:hypothetical protein